MNWLFTAIHGRYDGGEANAAGERLDLPWDGAEVGLFDSLADFWAAVAAVEAKDWLYGVHHPAVLGPGPRHLPLLDPDPGVRARALQQADAAATVAHGAGARYILFHFPVPGVAGPTVDPGLWRPDPPLVPAEAWAGQDVAAAALGALSGLAEVRERRSIEVVVETDGPLAGLYAGDLWARLLAQVPDLTLCVDTGRLELLARTHGLDGPDLLQRLLPRCRHLHLHEARWPDIPGRVPARPGLARADGWIGVAGPVQDWLGRHDRVRVVLEHSPGLATPAELAAAHGWIRRAVGAGRRDAALPPE